jgi:hypothetical protein
MAYVMPEHDSAVEARRRLAAPTIISAEIARRLFDSKHLGGTGVSAAGLARRG